MRNPEVWIQLERLPACCNGVIVLTSEIKGSPDNGANNQRRWIQFLCSLDLGNGLRMSPILHQVVGVIEMRHRVQRVEFNASAVLTFDGGPVPIVSILDENQRGVSLH